MRSRFSHLPVVLLLLSAAALCHAQLVPASIRFTGATGYGDAELAAAVDLKVGQGYTSDDLNHRAQQLLDTGLFDKVAYNFKDGKLTFTVKMSAQTYPIQVSSLPLETGVDLNDRLRARVPLYHGTVPPQGSMVEGIRHFCEEMLLAEGVRAHVGATLVEDPATHNAAVMRFSIDSNPVKVGTLKLEGVSAFLRPELDKAKVLTDVSYDSDQTAAVIEHSIMAVYFGHGFAAAQVHAVRYGYPVTDEGVIRVPYKVTVEEGRAYRLGTVKLQDGLPIDPAEVDKLMAERSTFMPESMFVKNLVSQVEFRLKGQGYLNCRVSLEPQLDDSAGVVNYTVEADLGPSNRAAL